MLNFTRHIHAPIFMVCRLDRARSWYVVYCSERFLFYIMCECLLEKYISYTLYKTHILTIRFSHTFATHMKYVPNMPLCGITLSMLYFTVDHATSIQLWIFSAFLNGRKQIVWRPGVSCTIWRKSNNMLDILQYLTILLSPIPYWDNIYYDLKLFVIKSTYIIKKDKFY